jgi:thioredoxin-related protein
MKKIYFIVLLIPIALFIYAMNFSNPWLKDFELAKKESKESGKPILLYFSGSDWCGICIKLKRDLFETQTFEKYASDNLILMQADFPRMKKNQLDEKEKKQNELLADKYNSQGVFPHLLLLNSEGKVLKEWLGDPKVKPEGFIEQLKKCKQPL